MPQERLRTRADSEQEQLPSFTLYLPAGPLSPGFLIVTDEADGKIVVSLSGALVGPILALFQARKDDAHLVPPAQGWRLPQMIADAISRRSPCLIPVEPQTIRRYVSLARRKIAAAARAAGRTEVPELFEHGRGLGIRLATDQLEVIDATTREE